MGIEEILKLIGPIAGFLGAVLTLIVYVAKTRKRFKNAKTDEEKQAIINEIKGKALGLINSAEIYFSDIPKSGASKLIYVLDSVKTICAENGIEYCESEWTDYVNKAVENANATFKDKEIESERVTIIENLKAEIPFFIENANELFKSIPDSINYRIEYVMNLVKTACEGKTVNVFNDYEWRSYVEDLYKGAK